MSSVGFVRDHSASALMGCAGNLFELGQAAGIIGRYDEDSAYLRMFVQQPSGKLSGYDCAPLSFKRPVKYRFNPAEGQARVDASVGVRRDQQTASLRTQAHHRRDNPGGGPSCRPPSSA